MPITTVRELMTGIVETLSAGDTLLAAKRQLERGRIRHLPVVDGAEHLIGLVTHRHILTAWVSHGQPGREAPDRVAAEVPVEMLMEKDVLTVDPGTSAAEAARLLRTYRFGCLPVVEHGKLVGIVTEADFVRFAQRFFEWEMETAAKSPPEAPLG